MADPADIANDTAQDTLNRVLSKAPKFDKPSLTECVVCEESIPIQRQRVGGITHCIDCQNNREGRR